MRAGALFSARTQNSYKLHPRFCAGVAMAFGMGEGEIEIILGPTTFTPQETMNGKVKISLPKATVARSITVEFYGEVENGNKFERVFRAAQVLGEERTYKNGETFDFSLTIPEQAKPPEAQGTFGSFQDLFVPKPHSWYIEAKIDIPLSPDIKSRISVYMRR